MLRWATLLIAGNRRATRQVMGATSLPRRDETEARGLDQVRFRRHCERETDPGRVFASWAEKVPSGRPRNTRLPAVARTPPQFGIFEPGVDTFGSP